MPNKKLFFIAILPPEHVMAEITAFKKDMQQNYGSKKALKVMPHITLKAPFKLPSEECEKVLQWFGKIPAGVRPFTIELVNFGSFDSKHNKVIFVQPLVTKEMAKLQTSIITDFNDAFPQINLNTHESNFKPHMTVAYRDLTPDNYELAWAVYKEKQYKASFTCSSFRLLQHNGRQWQVVQKRSLDL